MTFEFEITLQPLKKDVLYSMNMGKMNGIRIYNICNVEVLSIDRELHNTIQKQVFNFHNKAANAL